MAKCLVTGGCGFIGSHLVEALVGAGHSVRVLDDLSTGLRENLRSVEERVELLQGSVMEPAVVRAAMQGMDWVFHLAALPSVQRSLEDPATTHAVCATGTLNVLEAARTGRVKRVIYAASSSAYGDACPILRREVTPCRPLSPYAAAKLAGEHYCESYTHSFGLETVRLRFFNVFGPRQRADSPYAGVVAKFIAALSRGERLVLHGDGLQSRDFTYVDNAVQAFLLAATASLAAGNVYNVGCGSRTSIRQLARLLGELLGQDIQDIQPPHGPARPGDVRHSWAELRRTRRDLGYVPSVPLQEGLRRTVAAWQSEMAVAAPAGTLRTQLSDLTQAG